MQVALDPVEQNPAPFISFYINKSRNRNLNLHGGVTIKSLTISPCVATLYRLAMGMSAVSLLLLRYGSVKPYMCSSCQLAISPYVLKTSSPF